MKEARESKRAKTKNASEARERLADANKRFLEQFDERQDRDHARWFGRPRIDTGLFEVVARDEELAAKFGAKLVFPPKVSERARELNDLMNTLGLSGERRALFKQLIIAYHRERTI